MFKSKFISKMNNKSGFSVIEMIIVLAIAGAVLFIVFLAVPTAQRNSRNNGVTSDAASVLNGVYNYISQNDGELPTGPSATATGPDVPITGTGTSVTVKVQPTTTVQMITAGCANGTFPSTSGDIKIYMQCKCNAAATSNVASAKSISVLYSVESSSVQVGHCLEK